MRMLGKVTAKTAIQAQDFLRFAPKQQREEIRKRSRELAGLRVCHVNATAQGGGVAEILKSFIPYLRALGILGAWYALEPDKAGKQFFVVTDKMRYALHGKPTRISAAEWKLYERVCKKIAADLDKLTCDVMVLHDWQVLFSVRYLGKRRAHIYVSHADTSLASRPLWNKMLPAMRLFQVVVFSNRDFVHPGLPRQGVKIIPPVLDPLAFKQKIVSLRNARQYLARFGIPVAGPLIVQVSRFDSMKNPIGVIEAFLRIEKKYPQAHLALVGLEEATDNPSAGRFYQTVRSKVGTSKSISLFFNPKKIGGAQHIAQFTMMAQNAADVVVQNSSQEGFGLTLTEAMWKEKAVIGGPALGMKKQIAHGKNGYIAKNPQQLAEYVDYLLSHPSAGKRLGKAAKESVRKNFLMPRLLLDHLRMYQEVLP